MPHDPVTDNPTLDESSSSTDTYYYIKGDISGIQDFIFNVQSDNAARSLKGRSFFLKILLEVTMRMIFDDYEITDEDTISKAKVSTSGGNFILKLKINGTGKIEKIQSILTKSLQYSGLNIVLGYARYNNSFSETKTQVDLEIRKRKHQLLVNDFDFFQPFTKSYISAVNSNKGWIKLTDQLRVQTHCWIKKEAETFRPEFRISGKEIFFAGYRIGFSDAGEIKLLDHLESLFPIQEKDASKRVKTFQGLSVWGGERGINKLAILATDVDNLGFVIDGIKLEKDHSSFDNRLRTFFNHKLRSIIEQPPYTNNVYTVTAGGDDSYFIGKWNTMIDLAIDIKKAFEKAFADKIKISGQKVEKPLSISAAIVIVDPKFPINRSAQMVEDALKTAKYNYPKSRGNISLFDEVIKWPILENQIRKLRRLFRSLEREGTITSGLLTKARITTLNMLDKEGMQLSDYWKLSYYMRNFKGGGKEILGNYRAYLNESSQQSDELLKRNYRLIFPVAARLAEFDKRK